MKQAFVIILGLIAFSSIAQTDTNRRKISDKSLIDDSLRTRDSNQNRQDSMMNIRNNQNEQTWKKVQNRTWMGNDSVYYKLDGMGNLSVSSDNQNWSPSNDNMWQDRDGRWYKISNNKLMISGDGFTWCDAGNSKWRDQNGTWYRYNQDGVYPQVLIMIKHSNEKLVMTRLSLNKIIRVKKNLLCQRNINLL
jgi:hypothetical protein